MAKRKSLDLIVLLMISVFVISASAAVYYSLGMTSTITTAANDVYFVKGPDNQTAGVTLFNDNKSATLASLKAYPNMTMTYDDPIRVRNNHTTSSYNVRLRPVSRTGNAQYFVFINFTLNTTTPVSLNYTSNGVGWTDPQETVFVQVSANTEYALCVQTMANVTAPSGQPATIEIAIDVEDQ
jgi:hypothetical protein